MGAIRFMKDASIWQGRGSNIMETAMMNSNRLLVLFVVIATLSLPKGCPKQPAHKLVSLVLEAAPNVNPDPSGQALSVVVRVYQLDRKSTRLNSSHLGIS